MRLVVRGGGRLLEEGEGMENEVRVSRQEREGSHFGLRGECNNE